MRVKAAKERLDRFVYAYPSCVPGLTTWAASIPAADSAACWAAINDLAHRMRGDDPTRTLAQCRADAFVDLMLTNVTVTTTVTLMVPVQTMTVQEPHDSRERDLINRHDTSDNTATGPGAGWVPSGCPSLLASTDDFGQPAPDPNPMIEPTWQQICAMGYEIPGIGVIGGDIIASIPERFDTRIARVLLDERTGILIETGTDQYLPNQAMRRFLHKRDTHPTDHHDLAA